ncbi:hypothetical protein MUP35_04010 [Patescibacteria group bacterium]|nr:hypothetical protein [Patescibacteria group bacterium]
MKVKKGEKMVAFPQEILGKRNLPGIKTSRIQVGNKACISVLRKDMGQLCHLIGLKSSQIKMVKTDYNGVYLADVDEATKEGLIKDQVAVARQNYMNLCGFQRKNERIKALMEEISTISLDVENYQKNLVKSLRELEEKQLALQKIQNNDNEILKRFGDEFDQLIKHPYIEYLETVGNKLIVYTKPITITYEKVAYNIGKFNITIYTNGSNGCVKMYNLTHKLHYNHPHVNETGDPCLGNIKEIIPHLIAEKKYAATVSICIQFLKSYTFDDVYRPHERISDWPRVKLIRSKEERNV